MRQHFWHVLFYILTCIPTMARVWVCEGALLSWNSIQRRQLGCSIRIGLVTLLPRVSFFHSLYYFYLCLSVLHLGHYSPRAGWTVLSPTLHPLPPRDHSCSWQTFPTHGTSLYFSLPLPSLSSSESLFCFTGTGDSHFWVMEVWFPPESPLLPFKMRTESCAHAFDWSFSALEEETGPVLLNRSAGVNRQEKCRLQGTRGHVGNPSESRGRAKCQ